MIALIPARAGSRRCPGKNTRLLHGHPLIAYTIAAAQESGVFRNVYVSTEDRETQRLTRQYGAVFLPRPEAFAADDSPDIAWVRQACEMLRMAGCRDRAFAILRPTSPFRTAATIRRAYAEFQRMADCGDSIRAVECCPVNVYKCWTWAGAGMPITPLMANQWPHIPEMADRVFVPAGYTPLHSAPSQLAPPVWIQNSSLEMAYTANVEIHGSIAGRKIGPFFTDGLEGFSIDTEADFARAEQLAAAHPEWLPRIAVSAGAEAAGV